MTSQAGAARGVEGAMRGVGQVAPSVDGPSDPPSVDGWGDDGWPDLDLDLDRDEEESQEEAGKEAGKAAARDAAGDDGEGDARPTDARRAPPESWGLSDGEGEEGVDAAPGDEDGARRSTGDDAEGWGGAIAPGAHGNELHLLGGADGARRSHSRVGGGGHPEDETCVDDERFDPPPPAAGELKATDRETDETRPLEETGTPTIDDDDDAGNADDDPPQQSDRVPSPGDFDACDTAAAAALNASGDASQSENESSATSFSEAAGRSAVGDWTASRVEDGDWLDGVSSNGGDASPALNWSLNDTRTPGGMEGGGTPFTRDPSPLGQPFTTFQAAASTGAEDDAGVNVADKDGPREETAKRGEGGEREDARVGDLTLGALFAASGEEDDGDDVFGGGRGDVGGENKNDEANPNPRGLDPAPPLAQEGRGGDGDPEADVSAVTSATPSPFGASEDDDDDFFSSLGAGPVQSPRPAADAAGAAGGVGHAHADSTQSATQSASSFDAAVASDAPAPAIPFAENGDDDLFADLGSHAGELTGADVVASGVDHSEQAQVQAWSTSQHPHHHHHHHHHHQQQQQQQQQQQHDAQAWYGQGYGDQQQQQYDAQAVYGQGYADQQPAQYPAQGHDQQHYYQQPYQQQAQYPGYDQAQQGNGADYYGQQQQQYDQYGQHGQQPHGQHQYDQYEQLGQQPQQPQQYDQYGQYGQQPQQPQQYNQYDQYGKYGQQSHQQHPTGDYAQEAYQVQHAQSMVPSLLPQATFAGTAAPMQFMIPGQPSSSTASPGADSAGAVFEPSQTAPPPPPAAASLPAATYAPEPAPSYGPTPVSTAEAPPVYASVYEPTPAPAPTLTDSPAAFQPMIPGVPPAGAPPMQSGSDAVQQPPPPVHTTTPGATPSGGSSGTETAQAVFALEPSEAPPSFSANDAAFTSAYGGGGGDFAPPSLLPPQPAALVPATTHAQVAMVNATTHDGGEPHPAVVQPWTHATGWANQPTPAGGGMGGETPAVDAGWAAASSYPAAPGGEYASYPAASTEGDFSLAYAAAGSSHAAGSAGSARSPHGRPPCCTLSFGFGGRLAVGAPGYPGSSEGRSGAPPPGHVRLHALSDLIRDADPAMAGGGGDPTAAAQRHSVGGGYLHDLARSSGPMTRSMSVSQLATFAEERAAAASAWGKEPRGGGAGFVGGGGVSVRDGDGDDPEGHALLWGLLHAMCKHRGSLKGSGGDPTGDDPKGPSAELHALLIGSGDSRRSSVDGGRGHAVGGEGLGSARSSGGHHQISPLTSAGSAASGAEAAEKAAAAYERLLLAGRRGAALEVATSAGLWGHAMLLARHMGEQHFTATAAAMARAACAPGSPLHTLELMLAGLPQDLLGTGADGAAAGGARRLLPRWRENLAVLATNRAPGDQAVLAAMGDALWEERGCPAAAHVAYVLAGATPQPFHPSARVCLVGGDHRRRPRTYVTPSSVQRTELLEHAMGLANPQFVLAPFQPYKLVYAGFLAECGRVKEALGYAEAVLRALKSLDRACPECNVAALTAAAGELEHRLRGHNGAKGGILATAASSIFGGFSKMFDKGVHSLFGENERVGGVPSHPQTGAGPRTVGNGVDPGGFGGVNGGAVGRSQSMPRFDGDQNTSSQASSAGSPGKQGGEGDGGGELSRSVPTSASKSASKAKNSIWRSMSGMMGAVGAAIPLPKPKNQAKLGEENTMYYNEALGRWVEPGKEDEVDTAPPPPPPTSFGGGAPGNAASSAQGYMQGYTTGTDPGGGGAETTSGGAAPPPSAFSMRANTGGGVRSRYVVTPGLSGGQAGSGGPSLPAAAGADPLAGLMPPGAAMAGLGAHPAGAGVAMPMMPMMPLGAGGGSAVPMMPMQPTTPATPVEEAAAPTMPMMPMTPMMPMPVTPEAPADEARAVAEVDTGETNVADESSPVAPPPLTVADPVRLAADREEADGDAAAPMPPPMIPSAAGSGEGPDAASVDTIPPPPTTTGSAPPAFFVPGPAPIPSEEYGGTLGSGAATTAAADAYDYGDDAGVYADGAYAGGDVDSAPAPSVKAQASDDAAAAVTAANGDAGDGIDGKDEYAHQTATGFVGVGEPEDAPVGGEGHDDFGAFGEGDSSGTPLAQEGLDPQRERGEGYYGAGGVWIEGIFPGGFYGDTGEWMSGYYDETGAFHEGYYNQMGDWVVGQPPVGYYNENGEFVQGVYPGGVYNADGVWMCGYYTETGDFVEGFYSETGEWIERQPRYGGFHDENGIFVPQDVAPEEEAGEDGAMTEMQL